jgi:hypothetical protein
MEPTEYAIGGAEFGIPSLSQNTPMSDFQRAKAALQLIFDAEAKFGSSDIGGLRVAIEQARAMLK